MTNFVLRSRPNGRENCEICYQSSRTEENKEDTEKTWIREPSNITKKGRDNRQQ